ncbi:MAG TPA: GrpB family protein [Planctomycetaceae bacterium]|nr:GrpB family protein [Planctomycetaceae bacterium]
MPPPIAVELVPHDPQWAAVARRESARLIDALGDALVTVHHVGSTAIPGIRAKPILDLIPVFATAAALDATQSRMESLGYAAWGEYGLPGRRYYTFDDPATGRRTVQLHGYLVGSSEITRHLAFRDYLRAHPDIALAYDAEKARCRELHPLDSHAYSDCKCDWIRGVEAEALRTRG